MQLTEKFKYLTKKLTLILTLTLTFGTVGQYGLELMPVVVCVCVVYMRLHTT